MCHFNVLTGKANVSHVLVDTDGFIFKPGICIKAELPLNEGSPAEVKIFILPLSEKEILDGWGGRST